MNKQFNNQFATQKLRQEMSVTNAGGATFTPGTGEQMATNKAFKKKPKKEVKDVEPKLAAGKAKIYMKDKWGWKEAPSIPNRPSKGGFIYKQLFEELSKAINTEAYNETNLNVILNDIQSHIETSSVLDTGFKEWALTEFEGLKTAIDNEEWYDALYTLEDINDALQQVNKREWEEVYKDMFEKAFRRVESLAIEQDDDHGEDDDYGSDNPDDDYGPTIKEKNIDEIFSQKDYDRVKVVLSKIRDKNSKLYNAIIDALSDVYPHDLDKEFGSDIQAAGLNENYSRFKNETKTRGKSDQFHQAVRAVRQKVQEINRLFEYVSRLKQELSEGEGGLKYRMHTEKALAKIKDMVNELNKNVKKFK